MKNTIKNFAATFFLLIAVTVCLSAAAAQNPGLCDGSDSSRTVDLYGWVYHADGVTGVENMPVRAYANIAYGVSIVTGYTQFDGRYSLNLTCGRTYYITVDTKHPNGNFGSTPDSSPINQTISITPSSPLLPRGADFTLPFCTVVGNTSIKGLALERLTPNASDTPLTGIIVTAVNPQDNSLQSYGVSTSTVTDSSNFQIDGLFPCSNYKLVPYYDPAIYAYVSPDPTQFANTGLLGFQSSTLIDGVDTNNWNSLFNYFTGHRR